MNTLFTLVVTLTTPFVSFAAIGGLDICPHCQYGCNSNGCFEPLAARPDAQKDLLKLVHLDRDTGFYMSADQLENLQHHIFQGNDCAFNSAQLTALCYAMKDQLFEKGNSDDL